jgi:hypothetical protein
MRHTPPLRRIVQTLPILALSADASGGAQPGTSTIAIDHRGVGCVEAGRFPRLEAAISPSGEVSRARVLFRPRAAAPWYAVAMKGEGNVFAAALPKPKKTLAEFEYYIEAVGRAFDVARTPEYRPRVVSGRMACEQGRVMAGSVEAASVAVEVPAGAPAVPAGFATTGVTAAAATGAVATAAATTAAASGIGATALVVGGVAVAGGAVAAVAAASGGESAPTTTLPPPTLTGRWTGTALETDRVGQCMATWGITLNLTESAGSLSGDITIDGRGATTGVYECLGNPGVTIRAPLSNGTVSGDAVHMVWPGTFTTPRQSLSFTWILDGTATLDRRTMSGTWVEPVFAGGGQDGGTWTATKQ